MAGKHKKSNYCLVDKNRSSNAYSTNRVCGGGIILHNQGSNTSVSEWNIGPDVLMLASALYSTQTLSQPADFNSWEVDIDRTEKTSIVSWRMAASIAPACQVFVHTFRQDGKPVSRNSYKER